jgi:hypothetical protein
MVNLDLLPGYSYRSQVIAVYQNITDLLNKGGKKIAIIRDLHITILFLKKKP